jgi:hypothetical protein
MSAMIQFPLDLPDVEVLKTELSAKGHLVITVESTALGDAMPALRAGDQRVPRP